MALSFLLLIVLVIPGLFFWLGVLIDCLWKEPNSSRKWLWILAIIFGSLLGALAYLVIRRPHRIDLYGR